MSFVNRKLYKQKPQAWGPVSSVQASIFKNAERIGIDPDFIALAMPLWGPGNQIDYAKWYIGTNTNMVFQKNALENPDGGLRYISTNYAGVSGAGDRSVIFTYTPRNTLQKNILGYGANANYQLFDVASDTNGFIKLHIYSITYTFSNSLLYTVGKTDTYAITFKDATVLSGFQGGHKKSEIPATEINTTTTSTLQIGKGVYDLVNRPTLSISQVLFFNAALHQNSAAFLTDNPYSLLHRVPPVFYSVPGGGIIIKNITDSCIGTDSIAQISNFFSVSDAGAGADGFAGLTADLSVVDAGSGVDTVKPIASLTVQDTGSAIDLIKQISAVCSVADTGTGTDSIGQLLASLVVSDAGAGADVITVLKELLKTVTDSGTGTDSISRILASLSVSDTGSSTDTISQIIAGVSVSDDGSGADFINLLKDILKTISDTGSGTDSVSIQPVSVSVQDAGTALDIIGHIAVALSVSDAGTIAEIISTIKTKMVTVTDTGTGYDSAPTISVSLTVSDTAAALDLVGQVINALTVSDTGTGLESITKTDFDILPSGKVTVTFAMRTPKATFNIE